MWMVDSICGPVMDRSLLWWLLGLPGRRWMKNSSIYTMKSAVDETAHMHVAFFFFFFILLLTTAANVRVCYSVSVHLTCLTTLHVWHWFIAPFSITRCLPHGLRGGSVCNQRWVFGHHLHKSLSTALPPHTERHPSTFSWSCSQPASQSVSRGLIV